MNWALAKQRDWRIILRIEDLDTPRVKDNADKQAIEMLKWLGIGWDEGPYYQLADLSAYREVLERLAEAGEIYRCKATRKDIKDAQSAPHGDEHELRYPRLNRPADGVVQKFDFSDDGSYAWRIKVGDDAIVFEDEYAGKQSINIDAITGDFVVASKAGLPAYQLAVVVDDHRQGVTHVVRGNDLISSAARQMWIYEKLGYEPLPKYIHLPLIIGEDGRRLAKRHGDTRLVSYKHEGVRAEKIIGLVAKWCGMTGEECVEMSGAEFAQGLELRKIPKADTVFTAAEQEWLVRGCG